MINIQRTLYANKNDLKKIPSTQIMDMFEDDVDENKQHFDTLRFDNIMKIYYKNKPYLVTLYIQKYDRSKKINIDDDITFTKLKQRYVGKYFFSDENYKSTLINCLIGFFKNNKVTNNDILEFETPILFRAQNKNNRTGYGNAFEGNIQVEFGTQYGETTNYCIIAASFLNRHGR